MLYRKSPELQDALIRSGVQYDNAPAVRSDTPILSEAAGRQAVGRARGEQAQRGLNRGEQRMGLRRAAHEFQKRVGADRIQTARDDFGRAKKSGRTASLLGLAGLGLKTAGAINTKKQNDRIISVISDMEKQTREAGDAEGLLVAQILKAKYGE